MAITNAREAFAMNKMLAAAVHVLDNSLWIATTQERALCLLPLETVIHSESPRR